MKPVQTLEQPAGTQMAKSEESFAERYRRRNQRIVTPEEAVELSRKDVIASRDSKNWHRYEVEETGPDGSLGVRIPPAFVL